MVSVYTKSLKLDRVIGLGLKHNQKKKQYVDVINTKPPKAERNMKKEQFKVKK